MRQTVVPIQAPDQPVKVESTSLVTVSVTTLPSEYSAVQVAPQFIPPGELDTPPEPSPDFWTESENTAGGEVFVTGEEEKKVHEASIVAKETPPTMIVFVVK
jgi:hypothetical protein